MFDLLFDLDRELDNERFDKAGRCLDDLLRFLFTLPWYLNPLLKIYFFPNDSLIVFKLY